MIIKVKSRVYAGRVRDRNTLIKSSSGGAFTAISDFFLMNGDAIVCSSYDYKNQEVKYRLMLTAAERDAARGSMYIQSKPYDVFKEAEKWLKNNPQKQLLFVGVGCQAEGFRKYVEMLGFRDRVAIVDIICHGTPSPKIWREYAAILGLTNDLSFRDKRKGWKNPTAVAQVNGKEISIKRYTHIFYECCALRPACHVCPFATIERNSDITIGDFWNIEKKMPDFFDDMGTSLFLIHTDKGVDLFEGIKRRIDYRESNTSDCWQQNLESPTPVSPLREEFWTDYYRNGVGFIMKKYGADPIVIRAMRKLQKIFGGGY